MTRTISTRVQRFFHLIFSLIIVRLQALRYDVQAKEQDHTQEDELVSKRSSTSLSAPADRQERDVIISASGQPLSLLATFLIQRACNSPVVANFFYWYLKVETEDDLLGPMFLDVFDTFIVQISTHNEEGRNVAKRQRALDEYMKRISACQVQAREEKGRKDAKEAKLKVLLKERAMEIPGGVSSVPMPLDPTINISGLQPERTIMFSSAIYPAVLTFDVVNDGSEDMRDAPAVCKVIFKSGDDLRQDQLVVQVGRD